MRVLLLSRYGNLGASSRYRSLQYLPFLCEKGVEVTASAFSSNLYLERLYRGQRTLVSDVLRSYTRRIAHMLRADKFDLIWLEYEALPWVPYWCESMFVNSGVPYIVDYDDAIFHRYGQHSSALIRRLLGKKIDYVMQNATVVIAGNKYLAEHAQKIGARRIVILPTVVDLDRYQRVSQPGSSSFTIGWIGTPRTVHYLKSIREVLQSVCRNEDAKLVVVGAPPFKLDGVLIENITWSEETEVAEIMNFDVGIMPLIDSPWERGKCGHKLIQYMACGKPVVASPVGVNSDVVEHGVNGFLASTPEEWVEALTQLRERRTLCAKMGEAGRRKVETKYCLQVTAPRLASLITNVVKGKE